MNTTLQTSTGNLQTLSLDEIDEVGGGISPGVGYAIRVGLALGGLGVAGVVIGFGAYAAIQYLNEP